MEKLDRNSARPLYVQLGDIIREAIQNGEWQPDQMIPSENELARSYGISRVTARAVLKELVSEGLLYRVQGKGTFVAERKIEMLNPAHGGVSRQLETLGKDIRVRVVDFSLTVPSRSVAKTLGISPDTPIRYICRVRYADNEPVSIHKTYIPYSYCPTLKAEDLESEPLCDIMQREFNLTPDYIQETLEITKAMDYEAELLNMKPGDTIILMEGIGADKTMKTYQVAKILFCGNRVKLHFRYGPGQRLLD